MTNKVYDVLKWIALVGLPAITTLYLTLATIWGFPYAEASEPRWEQLMCSLVQSSESVPSAMPRH